MLLNAINAVIATKTAVLFWLTGFQRYNPDIPVGDGAVVALQHKGAGWFFIPVGAGAGWPGYLDVPVHQNTIMDDLLEASVGNFLTAFVKPRSVKDTIITLPLSRRQTCIDPRRTALVSFGCSVFVPSLIDAAAVVELRLLYAPTIEYLNLISAHKIYAGV